MSEETNLSEDKTDDTPIPRWDVINKMFNGFDKVLEEQEDDKMLTFFEIQSAVTMLNEKINQEKLNMYLAYLNSEHHATRPSNMYK